MKRAHRPAGAAGKLIAAALAVLILASCAPFATTVLNTSLGDEAALLFVTDQMSPCGAVATTGLCFAPGGEPALGVKIDIIANAAYNLDDACQPETYGATCDLGDVTSPTFVTITAEDVTATALYRRPGSNRIRQEAARF